MKRAVIGVVVGLMGFLGTGVPAAPAADQTLDLTADGSSGSVGDAFFQQTDPFVTGTGNINSFVQIGDARGSKEDPKDPDSLLNADITEAYNTTENGTFDVGPSDQFNHELLLSDVPIVSLDPDGDTVFTDYREFLLDINQAKNVNPSLLSLDEIQVFLSGDPNQDTEAFDVDGLVDLNDSSLIYRLDFHGDDNHWIKLNYSLNTGSGSGDMFMYIPDSLFVGEEGQDYVYLYSRFGENIHNNDGFEEWAVRKDITIPPCTPQTCPPPPPGIPEPASLLLMGGGFFGLLGFGGSRKRA